MPSEGKRQSISKQLRFEVFKRDGFRCQYCGAAAPTVLLEIDHIKPVAEGGTNDILNLITACQLCNAGKGARELTSQAALVRQVNQLTELNERREQLEMMIRWKEDLTDLKDGAIDRICDYWAKLVPGYLLNDAGKQTLRQLSTQFELSEIMDAMQTASDQYLEFRDGELVPESADVAWEKVAGICRVRRAEKAKPYLRDLLYIRGIMRKRNFYIPEDLILFLESAHLAGVSTDRIRELAKSCRNWTHFREQVSSLIPNAELGGPGHER